MLTAVFSILNSSLDLLKRAAPEPGLLINQELFCVLRF